MSELINFIKWRWSRIDYKLTDYIWFLGSFFFGSSLYQTIAHPSQGTPWQLYAGLGCWMFVMLKWLIWDTTKRQWELYKQEKANLFNTIDKGN